MGLRERSAENWVFLVAASKTSGGDTNGTRGGVFDLPSEDNHTVRFCLFLLFRS